MSSIPLSRSLLTRITLLMLTLVLLALVSLATSAWLSEKSEGRAFVINKAGSLRMQSYRLLSRVPLQHDTDLQMLEQDLQDPVLVRILASDGLSEEQQQLWQRWLQLKTGFQAATASRQLSDEVADFVAVINTLVAQLEQNTEASLQRQSWLQFMVVFAMLMILVVAVIYLHRRLLTPLRRLLLVARAVGNGDFACHSGIDGDDEMAVLAATMDTMNRQLFELYSRLEQKVDQQTRALVSANQTLTTLYETQRLLQGSQPVYQQLELLLARLQQITPLLDIRIRLYEDEDTSQYREISGSRSLPTSGHMREWRLQDDSALYGRVTARLCSQQPMTDDQQQLLDSILDLLTTALARERHQLRLQQLQLMEERATIARELHDSLAQALTYLKLQLSYVQLQLSEPSPEVATGLEDMREGLNNAYRQLRELLTSFRLKLDKPGLYAALCDTVAEFNRHLGFEITFDYALLPHQLTPNQTIHLVQITREALHNVVKHAGASAVQVRLFQVDERVCLSVRDNGRGLIRKAGAEPHYGLQIIQDRAASLGGDVRIDNELEHGGTEVRLCFTP